jgi:hypothetical protein
MSNFRVMDALRALAAIIIVSDSRGHVRASQAPADGISELAGRVLRRSAGSGRVGHRLGVKRRVHVPGSNDTTAIVRRVPRAGSAGDAVPLCWRRAPSRSVDRHIAGNIITAAPERSRARKRAAEQRLVSGKDETFAQRAFEVLTRRIGEECSGDGPRSSLLTMVSQPSQPPLSDGMG